MRRLTLFLAALAAFTLTGAPAADARCHTPACNRWDRTAAPYAGWLRSMTLCESGGHGWYRLRSTGNGFYFAAQFTPRTWASVGGRTVGGVPYGYRGGAVPTHAEVNYRAVRVRWAQGTGAWPRCG